MVRSKRGPFLLALLTLHVACSPPGMFASPINSPSPTATAVTPAPNETATASPTATAVPVAAATPVVTPVSTVRAPTAAPATPPRTPSPPPPTAQPTPPPTPRPSPTVSPPTGTPNPTPTWTAVPNPAIPAGVSGCVAQGGFSPVYDCLARGLPSGATPVYVTVNGALIVPSASIQLPPVSPQGDVPFPYGQAPNSGRATIVVSAGGATVSFDAYWPCRRLSGVVC